MAFRTTRGRPRKPLNDNDPGTPELRLKHALKITSEPIDVCLEKSLITEDQHWCGLHLRWLYTLRYGAPSLTSRYHDAPCDAGTSGDEISRWREAREEEFRHATRALHQAKIYEPVMQLAVFNLTPAFLSPRLLQQSVTTPTLANRLNDQLNNVRSGLELLRGLWRPPAHTRHQSGGIP